MSSSRILLTWVGALVLLAGAVALGLATGPAPQSFEELLRAALDPLAPGHRSARAILLDVRALRIGGSFAVGASLSLAGVLLQAATRNPIADPYLVGTSAGATLAAVGVATAAATLGGGLPLLPAMAWLQPLAAFVGAMAAVSVALWLARVGGPSSPERILLAGLVLTAFAGAATSYLLYRSSDVQLRAATGWLMGGVNTTDPLQLIPAALVLAVSASWGLLRGRDLNALGVGEEAALGVGIDNARIIRLSVWLSSALAAVAVALAGIVGFVGLLVPHGLRATVGRDHRVLVPCSVLVGGAFLVVADALARVIVAPAELPVGILTALAGCPLLLAFLRRRHRVHRLERPPRAASAERPAPPSDALLCCRSLTASYSGAEFALGPCDLELGGGELVALVGPNGSGKSTLLRALAGAIPSGGRLTDAGRPRGADRRPDPRHLAWLPQTLRHEPGTRVADLATIGRTPWLEETLAGRLLGQPSRTDREAVREALLRVEMWERRDEVLDHLSGGQRQRAFLAMVLAQQARVLLLDEPTTALDLPAAAALLTDLGTFARERGAAALIAIHDLALATARCDRLVVMADGRILATGRMRSEPIRRALVQAFGPEVRDFLPPLDPAGGQPTAARAAAEKAGPSSSRPLIHR